MTPRDYLNAYTKAHRDIELAEVAIEILEGVTGCQSLIDSLKRKEQAFLRRMDSAAEGLSAPYKKDTK